MVWDRQLLGGTDVPPLKADDTFLQQFLRRCLQRLEIAEHLDEYVVAAVASWPDLHLGTMCSGTDCPVMVYEDLKAVLAEKGIEWTFVHCFSSEKATGKRSFIRQVFQKRILAMYTDMCLMTRDELPDVVEDEKVFRLSKVGGVTVLIAGFPCTVVSGLNMYAATTFNKNTIKSGQGATGKCFHSIIAYAEKHGVKIIILENVPGLRLHGRLDDCEAMLRAAGYIVISKDLFSSRCGLPQDRHRLYIFCIKADLKSYGVSDKAIIDLYNRSFEVMDQLDPPMQLEDFLMGPSSAELQAYCDECLRLPNDAAITKHHTNIAKAKLDDPSLEHAKGLKWCAQHAKFFGNNWTRDVKLKDGQVLLGTPASFAQFPGLKAVPLRQLDMLMSECPALPEENNRILDISQGVERACKSIKTQDATGTVTPAGDFFLTKWGRLLRGTEKLKMQGIFVKDIHKYGFSDSLLSSLAGNAFATPSAAIVILSSLVVMGSPLVDNGEHGKDDWESSVWGCEPAEK